MTQDELGAVVQRSMDEKMFRQPGAVLFSGIATIKRSRFYVMGLNPGGYSKTVTRSIIDTLAPADGTSPYSHQCWNKACGDECEHLTGDALAESDLVRHQKNMIALARVLGYNKSAEVPSANAIFARSCSLATLADETGYSAWE